MADDTASQYMDTIQAWLNALDGIAYVVDGRWAVLAVGQPHWMESALAGQAPALARGEILIGHSLMDYIHGTKVRAKWTEALEQLALRRQTSIAVPYRCDSPGNARRMHMSLTRLDLPDGVERYLFQSILLEEFTRPPMDIFAPEAMGNDPSLPMVAVCSFCGAVRQSEEGVWSAPETYYAKGGTSRVRVSHSVCPACEGVWIASLGLD